MGDMKKVTAIVLAYNRPWNVEKWIAGIRRQTVPAEIWVWDNSDKEGFPPEYRPMVDTVIYSSRNFDCLPRFLLAGAVRSPFVFNQDDDMEITDKFLFEKLIGASAKYPDAFFGWNGRLFDEPDRINWDMAYQSPGYGHVGGMDRAADMVNTGVSFYPTALINQLPLNPYRNDMLQVTPEEYRYGDDIYVSKFLKHVRVTSFMQKGVKCLDEMGVGISKETPHMRVRNNLCRRFFKEQPEEKSSTGVQPPPYDEVTESWDPGKEVKVHPEREVLP